ncbi:MAG: PglZ domain-containing protein [Candidatus Helarchaeota archaeon]
MHKFSLQEFLQDFLKNIKLKPIILILDRSNCVSHLADKYNNDMKLFDNSKPFILKYIKRENDFYQIRDKINFDIKNLIIFFTNNKLKDELKINDNIILLEVYPENIFNFVRGNNNKNWDVYLRQFQCFSVYVSEFLIKHEDRYDSIFLAKNSSDERKQEFLIQCFFKDFEIHKSKEFYILEKIITHNKLIKELSKSTAERLYNIFKEYLKAIFSNSEIYKFLLFIIENEMLDNLIYLIIEIGIISQLKDNVVLEDYIHFKDKISIVSKFKNKELNSNNKEKFKLFITKNFKEIKDLFTNFLAYELEENRINDLIQLIEPFKLSKLIIIEKRLNFFQEYLNSYNTIDRIKNLPLKNLIYSGIVIFSNFLLNYLFRRNPRRLFLNSRELYEIALITNILDDFRNNIYYKIKLKEYQIYYSFLKNIIKLYLFLRKLEKILSDIKNNQNNYNLNEWKKIHTDILIPIDNLCWNISENSRLFWIKDDISDILKLLSEYVVLKIKEVHKYFLKFLKDNYPIWVENTIKNTNNAPVSVVNVIRKFFNPNNNSGDYYLFLILDCCRIELWYRLRNFILEDFPELSSKTIIGLSIIPTSTQFARLSLFSGKYPHQISGPNEAQNFIDYIRSSSQMRTQFNIQFLNNQINNDSIYTGNCELLEKNNKAIKNLSNNINFQICIFNCSDSISHNFEMSMTFKVLTEIYTNKIRPLIRKILELKSNPIIFFGTDHGIAKLYTPIDWKNTNFNEHWEEDNRENFIIRKNRWFVSKRTLTGKQLDDILRIESDFYKWGLKSKINDEKVGGYYFGTAYDDLLKKGGKAATYYAHGGASTFELFIPFAILFKESRREIPKNPILEVLKDNKSIYLIITNPNNLPISNLNIDLFIYEYHFIFQKLFLEPNSSQKINLNISSYSNNQKFYYTLEYEYLERKYYLSFSL